MRIVSDRIFLRTSTGRLTPCILVANEEEKYTCSKPRAKRWMLASATCLDRTKEDLCSIAAAGIHSETTYWRTKNGTYVEGRGFSRWMQSGIENAVTLEELFEVNNFNHITACLMRRIENKWVPEFKSKITSTSAFESWIAKAKARALELLKDKEEKTAYAVTFPTNKSVVKPKKGNLPKQFAIYLNHSGYLEDIVGDTVVWSGNIHNARIFEMDDYKELIKREVIASELEKAKPLSADTLWNNPHNAVLRVASGKKEGMYFARRTKRNVYLTMSLSEAKHFKNIVEANRLCEDIQRSFPEGRFAVEIDTFEDVFDEFHLETYKGSMRKAQLNGQLSIKVPRVQAASKQRRRRTKTSQNPFEMPISRRWKLLGNKQISFLPE